MLTGTIIVARVQPGTSKGITDLLLPQPSSVLKALAVALVSLYLCNLSQSPVPQNEPNEQARNRTNMKAVMGKVEKAESAKLIAER